MKRMENFGIKILRNSLKSTKNSRELLHHLRRDVRNGSIILKKGLSAELNFLVNQPNMGKKKIIKTQPMTKGQTEAEVSNALIAFEKDHMGRGPVDVRTHIIQDMVLIRLKGVLTPAEQHLAKDEEGINLIKQVRAKLLENASEILAEVIKGITGCAVISFHTDISTKTGERIIVITLEEDMERRLPLKR